MPSSPSDEYWMSRALGWAQLAADRGEVPIGAVVVLNGDIIGAAHDSKETFHDPTAHAELLALQEAARVVGDWRLDGAVLYATLEPCPMCAGALVQARISRLVYGATNVRWGACSSDPNILTQPRFNHQVEVTAGILEAQCADLLRKTFKRYRGKL